jgi:dTDP-glucose pyrophosphorylase
VSEYLVDRMLLAGATRLCFVISAGKSDVLGYYGAQVGDAHVCYVVQQAPRGLCDAIFCAAPLIRPEDTVLIGLPDTIWFPEDGFRKIAVSVHDQLTFLLFPVAHPELFDAVITDARGAVREIQVKTPGAQDRWIWGALSMPGHVLHALCRLWRAPDRHDEYVGTLINAYLATGGGVSALPVGEAYVDVGTMHGYREAIRLLDARFPKEAAQ